MGLIDDMMALGLDPKKTAPDLSNVDVSKMDPWAVMQILAPVSNWELYGSDPAEEALRDRLNGIRREYQSQTISADWTERAVKGIMDAYRCFERKDYFTQRSDWFTPIYEDRRDYAREIYNPSVTVSEQPLSAFAGDLFALGININGTLLNTRAPVSEIEKAAPIVRAMTELMEEMPSMKNDLVFSKLSTMREEFEKNNPGGSWKMLAGSQLYAIWTQYQTLDEEKKATFDKIYEKKLNEARKAYGIGIPLEKEGHAPASQGVQDKSVVPAVPSAVDETVAKKGEKKTAAQLVEEEKKNPSVSSSASKKTPTTGKKKEPGRTRNGRAMAPAKPSAPRRSFFEDMKAAGLDVTKVSADLSDVDVSKLDAQKLAPILFAVSDVYNRDYDPVLDDRMSELRKAYKPDSVSDDWVKETAKALLAASENKRHPLFAPGGNWRYMEVAEQYNATEWKDWKKGKSDLPGPADGKTAEKPETTMTAQEEQVARIRDIQEKMKAEKHGLHWNSTEYENMVKAVNAVCSIDYHPNDPESVRKMQEALDNVQKAADAYAEKEAYKEKKTDRGIERRNTALSLLAITDAKGINGLLKRVQEEKQMDSLNPDASRKTRKAGTKTSIKTLIEDDQKKTHDLAEKRRQERKEHQKDAPAKKADGPEKK